MQTKPENNRSSSSKKKPNPNHFKAILIWWWTCARMCIYITWFLSIWGLPAEHLNRIRWVAFCIWADFEWNKNTILHCEGRNDDLTAKFGMKLATNLLEILANQRNQELWSSVQRTEQKKVWVICPPTPSTINRDFAPLSYKWKLTRDTILLAGTGVAKPSRFGNVYVSSICPRNQFVLTNYMWFLIRVQICFLCSCPPPPQILYT